MADTADLKSASIRCEGSSPFPGTIHLQASAAGHAEQAGDWQKDKSLSLYQTCFSIRQGDMTDILRSTGRRGFLKRRPLSKVESPVGLAALLI